MSLVPDTAEKLLALYTHAGQTRMEQLTEAQAESLYSRPLRFCCHFASRGSFLDVGCGSGWLTYLLAKRGFDATGVDLNPEAFEPPPLPNLSFRQGNATRLPFDDKSFDVVLANTVLEHTPQPQEVLLEMKRVLRPGGLLIVTGPNLVALGPSIKGLLSLPWRRPFRDVFFRRANMQRFPYGTTLPEILAHLFMNMLRIPRKLLTRTPLFVFRTPDLIPPFHGDNDAIYLCCPVDICRFLTRQGFDILRDVDVGRLRITRSLAGGTWVAARLRNGAPG